MSAVTLRLYELDFDGQDTSPYFESTTCTVQAQPGKRLVGLFLLPEDFVQPDELRLDADEARSLAAALLAAADASESEAVS